LQELLFEDAIKVNHHHQHRLRIFQRNAIMRTCLKLLCVGWAVAAVSFSMRAQAALLAYDGFNYPTAGASVVGQADGGASFGWNGGWTDNTARMDTAVGTVLVNTTGMTYSKSGIPLQVSGGKVEQLDLNTYLPYRTLAAAVGGTGDLGANQSTIWVSFLVQNYGKNTTTPPLDPTLGNADNYLVWGTIAGLNSATAPASASATYVGGSRSNGNIMTGGIGGSSVSNFPSGTGLNGDVHLVVQRIIFGGGSSGSNMQVDAWLDPTPGLDPSANPGSFTGAVSGAATANLLLAGLFFRGMETGQGAFDEIRVGDTALDVLPVPEFSTFVLAGLGFAGLCFVRPGLARRSDKAL
jgi:hypothetical protein